MSLVTDSPVNSSSSDDFAAFLDVELDSTSDTSPDPGDDDNDNNEDNDENHDSVLLWTKRRKVEVVGSVVVPQGLALHEEPGNFLEASVEKDICTHPGVIGGMCIRCGQKMDDQSGVAFGYIHKDLRLANDEIDRLRNRDLKNLLRHKKLYLILDLDHTLLNSTRFQDMTPEEEYLKSQPDSLPDSLKGSLFRLDFMHMMTKLRPFVQTFLKEASKLFEMYIYTMGERAYALQMAKLLDPEIFYFNSKVIAQGDCTQRHQKGLDVVLGQDSAVLILDDTEQEHGDNLAQQDVRQVLKIVKKEVLKGCRVVFSRVFPTKFHAESHHLWKMAEQLGATCSREIDPSVTHVVSTDKGTDKSRWAVQENKFLVHPWWIEAANYLWKKQPEDNFPVNEVKQSK